MKEMKNEVESEELERKIKMKCEEKSITIMIEEINSIEKYRGVYEYQHLPFEFKVLFEDIEELYRFLAHDMHQVISVRAGMLCILVEIIGKLKEFQLPLEKIALTAQEQLAVQLHSLKTQLNERNQHFQALQFQIREKDSLIEEKEQGIASLNAQLKQKQTEHTKLLNKIRILQSNIEEMNTQKGKIESQEYTPVKKLPNSNKNSKKKQNEQLGTKILFTVDSSSKNLINFKTTPSGDLEKTNDTTSQLNHLQPLPKQGKYYFDIKIQPSKSKHTSNIIVGIITDKNKDMAHSCNKPNCICFNGYDSTICEQQKAKNAKIKPKEGDRIRTMVDMTLSQLQWFILGDDGSCLIGKANIPATMAKQSIYPFFELNFEGNSIKMNP